jgi:hypothetical protein
MMRPAPRDLGAFFLYPDSILRSKRVGIPQWIRYNKDNDCEDVWTRREFNARR